MSIAASPVHASEASSTQQIQCIARAIYGEAGNQSEKGQISVGLVIRARAHDQTGAWPSSYCGVIWQENQFYGASRHYVPDPQIEQIALEIAQGRHSFEEVGLPNCVRYFATHDQPFMKEVGRVGAHVFGCPNKS